MPKKEKPLPKPPSTPFKRKRPFEQGDKRETLVADQMAMAMSEGKLEEFIKKELPDNEHARKLAEMMMGMTGMMPAGFSGKPEPKKGPSKKAEQPLPAEKPSHAAPPDDVADAVKSGDVSGLMDILKREHNKRQGGETESVKETKKKAAPSKPQPAIEKEIIEQMLKIAHDNNLSLDWIFFRALKKYVQEYQNTGNL